MFAQSERKVKITALSRKLEQFEHLEISKKTLKNLFPEGKTYTHVCDRNYITWHGQTLKSADTKMSLFAISAMIGFGHRGRKTQPRDRLIFTASRVQAH